MSTEDKPTDEAAEMKRKFKEALDKKNAKHRDGEAHLDGDSSVHGTARRCADQARVPPQERLRGAVMVFDPTFHEISKEADDLPDLDGSDDDAEPLGADVEADDLPPEGAE